MAQLILSLLAALLPLLNKWLDWFFSSEQINQREADRADSKLQDFDKALKDNDAVYITGAALDLHDRVSAALRGR